VCVCVCFLVVDGARLVVSMPPRAGPYSDSLGGLVGARRCSIRSVVNLLKLAKDLGPQHGRDAFYKANRAAFAQVFVVERLPVIDDGDPFDLEMADAGLLVEMNVARSTVLQDLFLHGLEKQRCSQQQPWEVIEFCTHASRAFGYLTSLVISFFGTLRPLWDHFGVTARWDVTLLQKKRLP
jgi:hypothetical protein